MYTKGEWKAVKAQYEGKFPSIHIYREEAPEPIIGQGTGKVICIISNTDSPDAEANANLIAASPDMYEALKALISANIAYHGNDFIADNAYAPLTNAINAAKLAYTKAEGKGS